MVNKMIEKIKDFIEIDNKEVLRYLKYKNQNIDDNLSKMIELSRILSKNTYQLRVDFYEVNEKIYCGELTFFDGGGFYGFIPKKYNRILGDWIKLPIDN